MQRRRLGPFLTRRLRDSLALRREIEAARAWATPRSVFLGRIPRRGEPLWTDEDRAWAIALLEYEADLCSGCGQPRSETTEAANETKYTTTALRCHGCAAVARESEHRSGPLDDRKGLLIGVKLQRG